MSTVRVVWGPKPGTKTLPALPDAWETAVDDWCAWLKISGMAPRSIRLRRDHVRMVGRRLGVPSPAIVTLRALVRLCSHANWSLEHRKGVRSSLVGFFGWCVDNGVAAENPASQLPRVQLDRARPRPAPDEVWQHIVEKAAPRELLMIRLAGEAGLRRGEVARCHRDDLIGATGQYSLRVIGKGNKLRIVPIADGLAEAIQQHCLAGYLFPGGIDGHISENWAGQVISKLMPDGYTMHTLRHRFGTRAYRGSRNLRAVQELLGHASIATTERYTAVDAEEIRAAMMAASS